LGFLSSNVSSHHYFSLAYPIATLFWSLDYSSSTLDIFSYKIFFYSFVPHVICLKFSFRYYCLITDKLSSACSIFFNNSSYFYIFLSIFSFRILLAFCFLVYFYLLVFGVGLVFSLVLSLELIFFLGGFGGWVFCFFSYRFCCFSGSSAGTNPNFIAISKLIAFLAIRSTNVSCILASYSL